MSRRRCVSLAGTGSAARSMLYSRVVKSGTRLEGHRVNRADDLRKSPAFDAVTSRIVNSIKEPARSKPVMTAEKLVHPNKTNLLAAYMARLKHCREAATAAGWERLEDLNSTEQAHQVQVSIRRAICEALKSRAVNLSRKLLRKQLGRMDASVSLQHNSRRNSTARDRGRGLHSFHRRGSCWTHMQSSNGELMHIHETLAVRIELPFSPRPPARKRQHDDTTAPE